jgi:hypothetical protein
MQHGWRSRDCVTVRLPCLGSGVVSDVTSLESALATALRLALSCQARKSRRFPAEGSRGSSSEFTLPELIQPRLRQEEDCHAEKWLKSLLAACASRQVPTNKQEASGRHASLDVTAISCGVHQSVTVQ